MLASMGFIRDKHRSLPPSVLRQGRAKLARLLGRRHVQFAVRQPRRRAGIRRHAERSQHGGSRLVGDQDLVETRRNFHKGGI